MAKRDKDSSLLSRKIKKARDMVASKHPFFAAAIYHLSAIEDNNIPTAATDGEHFLYNRDFLSQLTDSELAAVFYHETLHCLYKHLWRKGDRSIEAFNVACDYAINITVNQSFTLPKGCLIDQKYYGMSAEEIYEKVKKNVKNKKILPQKWGDHSRWPGQQQNQKSSGSSAKDLFDRLTGKKKPPVESTKGDKQKAWEWSQIFKESVLEHYGDLPGSMQRVVSKYYHVPVIDWRSVLTGLLSQDDSDYVFSSPDRRFLSYDFLLPGVEGLNKIKDVIFAYDTSGSISHDDLSSYVKETKELFENFPNYNGHLAVCDAQLHDFINIDQDFDIDSVLWRGGGGTDFRPVFDKIKDEDLQPKAVFFFTDLEGAFPEIAPEYPVFWLLKTSIGEYIDTDVPFGQVIPFIGKAE